MDTHGTTTSVLLSGLAARTTTITGSSVDIGLYDGRVKIIQDMHTMTGTPTLDGKIQDSPDGSTGWADVTGATFVQVTAVAHEAIGLDTRKAKRYIRYVGTIGGGTPVLTGSVILVGTRHMT
jgi:hypothetical protein